MRVFYPVWQVTELAAGYRYTTQGQDVRQISVEKSQDDCKPKTFIVSIYRSINIEWFVID